MKIRDIMQFCLLCAALAFGSCTKDDGPSSQSLIDSRTKPMQEGTWEMIPELSDEFDGTSLNSDKWLDYHPYWAGRSPSKFVRENVKVEDGYLKLVASYDPDDYELWINSACVSSKEESCDYGYYEARIKVHGLSLSGSFWFQNEADPETNYDQLEIDYENVGDSKLYQQHSYASMITLHWGENWGANSYTVWDPYGEDRKCSDDFFIYGVEYGRDEIKMFINNRLVKVYDTQGPFEHKMYMFFDIEAFDWEGLPTVDELNWPEEKRTMYVDWVRSYRRVDAGAQTIGQ